MAIVVKVSNKPFNVAKLFEELASLPITSIGLAGFIRQGDRLHVPFPEDSRVIGSSSSSGNDVAQKGELRFSTSSDLTPAEDTSLTNILNNHNSATLSAEQVRQDQDEADLDAIIATERNAYLAALQTIQNSVNAINTALTGWDTANTAATKQKTEDAIVAMRDALVALRSNDSTTGKVLRYILRKERGATI